MLKKGRPQGFATATPATFATDSAFKAPTVATVATVAVANLQSPPANDPTPTTKVQADLSPIGDTKGLPTPPADGVLIDIGTARPPGLTPALLAASLALDAHIHADGPLPGNPDRWCYPDSTAMTGSEIDTFTARVQRFTAKGLPYAEAESTADRLVKRDRDSDDRRLCLECTHLGGYGRTSWRCGNWQAAGVAISQRDSQLPGDLVFQLQRCPGFAPPQRTAP